MRALALTGRLACGALAVAALVAAGGRVQAQGVTQPELRAAFLYNFAKFAEWPGDADPTGPLSLCVLDDGATESALHDLARNGSINGRSVVVSRRTGGQSLRSCHLLYLGDENATRAAAVLDEARGAPVLTVGNGEGFVRGGGMVGLFVEEGRMRFAINPAAAQRVGVRLSSRLLQLAKIHREVGGA